MKRPNGRSIFISCKSQSDGAQVVLEMTIYFWTGDYSMRLRFPTSKWTINYHHGYDAKRLRLAPLQEVDKLLTNLLQDSRNYHKLPS